MDAICRPFDHGGGAVPHRLLKLLEGFSPAKRHPGPHHPFRVVGIEGLFHPGLHVLQHLLLHGRDIGQAHEGAGFFGGHVHLDIHLHGGASQ